MHIAWYSPLRENIPLRTAIYTRAVVGLLPAEWKITLFVDDEDWEALGFSGLTSGVLELNGRNISVYHYHRMCEFQHDDPFTMFVYQLEDDSACRFVQRGLELWPGISFFHDLNLNTLHFSRFSHSTAGSDINDFMSEQFGAQAPKLGDWRVRGWPTEVLDSSFPTGAREVGESAVTVVLNPALHKVARRYADGPAACVRDVAPTSSQNEACSRGGLRLKESDWVVTLLGDSLLSDRIAVVLEAFSAVRAFVLEQNAEARLLWLTKNSQSLRFAEERIRSLPVDIQNSIVCSAGNSVQCVTGIRVADLCIALRNSSYRSLPCGVGVALSAGRPTIVADTAETSYLPADVVCKVSLGLGEAERLAAAMLRIYTDRTYATALGRAAQTFAVNAFDVPAAAIDCENLLRHYADFVRLEIQRRARRYQEMQNSLLGDKDFLVRQSQTRAYEI